VTIFVGFKALYDITLKLVSVMLWPGETVCFRDEQTQWMTIPTKKRIITELLIDKMAALCIVET